MTWDKGVMGAAELSLEAMQVGVADTTIEDLELHILRTELAALYRHELQGCVYSPRTVGLNIFHSESKQCRVTYGGKGSPFAPLPARSRAIRRSTSVRARLRG